MNCAGGAAPARRRRRRRRRDTLRGGGGGGGVRRGEPKSLSAPTPALVSAQDTNNRKTEQKSCKLDKFVFNISVSAAAAKNIVEKLKSEKPEDHLKVDEVVGRHLEVVEGEEDPTNNFFPAPIKV